MSEDGVARTAHYRAGVAGNPVANYFDEISYTLLDNTKNGTHIYYYTKYGMRAVAVVVFGKVVRTLHIRTAAEPAGQVYPQ